MTFCLLELQNVPILKQLQIEEMLLRADKRNWFIINRGSTPAVVMGLSGKPDELINTKKLSKAPIPLIKRFSGGGTVVVDEETLFVTFICAEDMHNFSAYPEPILRWTEGFYKEALALENFALKENDYVLGNKKCGGNAQYIRKGRWLHHSTFLWDFSSDNMDYLLMPKKQPSYRKSRSHGDFLCTLSSSFSSKQEFLKLCTEHLKKKYRVQEVALSEIETLPHRKATELLHIS